MTYEENQFLVVEMMQNLTEGQNYTLRTVFEGELAEDLGGLYRSTYENQNGESMYVMLLKVVKGSKVEAHAMPESKNVSPNPIRTRPIPPEPD